MSDLQPMLLLGACALGALASCSSKVEAESDGAYGAEGTEQAGWRPLFDGTTTAGWRGFKREDMPDGWAVEDGVLHCRGGDGGDIVTEEQFADFELALDWKISTSGNSGIFFHVAEGEYDAVWRTGPELQILDNAGHADGGNSLTSAGSNYALHAPAADVTRPVGEWNSSRIVVDGPHVEHWLNGVKQCEYELWSDEWRALVADSKFAAMPDYGMMKTGHIALQDHGNAVWFRNIRIRTLP